MSPNTDQCYTILGVRSDATPDEVKQAYRDLVREWHPDRLAHDARRQKIAEERLKEINVAYEHLQRLVPATHSGAPGTAERAGTAGRRPRRYSAGFSAYGSGWQRGTATGPPRDEEPDEETLTARATAYYDEGLARFESGEYTEAVSSLTQAVCIKPNLRDAYFVLGRAYTELGLPAKAAAAFKHVVRFQPDRVEAHDGLARSYLAMGAPKDAVWVSSQMLKRRPKAVPLLVTLGAAYRKLGQLTQSLEALSGAAEQEPANAQAQYELGETYVALGDTDTAREVYARLKSLDADLAVQLLLSILGAAR